MKNNRVISVAAIAAAALSGTTSAQPDCSCSPQAFTLKINLSGTCPASITNVDTSVDFCHVTKDDGTTPGVPTEQFGFPSDRNFDEVPAEIESISYYELNESLEAISQETIAVDDNVNEVTFTSVAANLDPEEFLSEQTQNIVSAAFLVLSGKNAEGISVKNTVTWQYDLRMCDKIPMAIGDTIGWVDVVGLKYAKSAFCPVVPATMEPTTSPTHKQETTTEATTTTTTTTTTTSMNVDTKSSKVSTKSSKVVSIHTKSSKTLDTKVQKISGSYGGYHFMLKNSQDNKSGNSKQSQSTTITTGTKSSKDSSSKAVAVNSKQSTKSSKTKSSKAVGNGVPTRRSHMSIQ